MRIAVMIVLDTDDPELKPQTIDVSATDAHALRAAVIRNLFRIDHVAMVLDQDVALFMTESVMEVAGLREPAL